MDRERASTNLGRASMRPGFLWICGWLAGVAACDSCEPSGHTTGSVADAAVQAAAADASATPPVIAPPPSAPAHAVAEPPLQILRMTFTSAVRNKEPVDQLDAAAPGQRVYAHLAVRNRSERTRQIRLAFEVNGNPRTSLELDVDPSWSYRTWGYNTVLAGDTKGELTLVVTDDEGEELTTARLPIRR